MEEHFGGLPPVGQTDEIDQHGGEPRTVGSVHHGVPRARSKEVSQFVKNDPGVDEAVSVEMNSPICPSVEAGEFTVTGEVEHQGEARVRPRRPRGRRRQGRSAPEVQCPMGELLGDCRGEVGDVGMMIEVEVQVPSGLAMSFFGPPDVPHVHLSFLLGGVESILLIVASWWTAVEGNDGSRVVAGWAVGPTTRPGAWRMAGAVPRAERGLRLSELLTAGRCRAIV
ncbi:hypothetical protein [Rhabdothermincola salaria]|uniref:hypothetical protein n=1 Tax=Rhabdothermincola salaria TaxID=2903142 RepID=UPI001E532065|nr:hypothetical protein [Rhabdothermincola salaria]MCD9624201.1 hypothetical protein [Rhabdothermincola salaria]